MASELAKKIYQLEWEQIDVIDAELQEVREVIEGMQLWIADDGTSHWCSSRFVCPPECQRARALREKLRIKEK